jgi:hypothetical protein
MYFIVPEIEPRWGRGGIVGGLWGL